MRKMRAAHPGRTVAGCPRTTHFAFLRHKTQNFKKVRKIFLKYLACRICFRQNAQTPIFHQNRQLLWVSPPCFPRDDIRMTNNPLYIRKKITQKPVRQGGFLLFFCQKKLIFFCQTPGRRKTAKKAFKSL